MPTFNATDSNLNRSEAWVITGSGLTLGTNRVGSYVSGIFTGTSITASVNADNTRVVASQVDDNPHVTQVLASGANTVTIGTGLATGTHKFKFFYNGRGANAGNRFDGPDVTLNSITCDALSAPLPKAPKRLYMFGDSIFALYQGANHADSISLSITEGLRPIWDVSSFAIGGTGWVNVGGGSMPIIGTHWNTAWTGTSYTFPAPDAVYICMGTNDGGHTDTAVQNNAVSTLNAMLTRWPSAKILLMTPWGGIKRTAVISAHGAVNSPRVILIDNSTEYNRGLTPGANDYYSNDDVHPNLQALPGIISRMGYDLGVYTAPAGSQQAAGTINATGTFTYV